jgi:hypothetical protein
MPATGGVLDADFVDGLGTRVHCELQRLGEELQFARRVATYLQALIKRLRGDGHQVVRIVDVGCGLGYLIRTLAAHRYLVKYLASALILGPFTLLRPLVAILGWLTSALWSHDPLAITATGLCVLGVLSVEPLADRRWYQ